MFRIEQYEGREFLVPETDHMSFNYFIGTDMQNIASSIAEIPEERDSLCIQAGGNLGFFPIHYAKRFKNVITFEPDPINFYCLSRNVLETNVVKIQAALGVKYQFIDIEVRDPNHIGQNRVRPDAKGSIPTLRIDDLHVPACDLIQLDLEGYELFALEGAIQTIREYHPFITLEFAGHTNDYGASEQQVVDLLYDLDYIQVGSCYLDKTFKWNGNVRKVYV